MYEEYFGLKRPPFRITPDTSLFFDGGERGDILGALVYAVHRGEGIIKVVGEVGSGKTMLCRMLQVELPENVEIIYIANPSVSPEDILFVIADELHFDVARDASKHELVSMLQKYLLKKHEEDKQVVLFVEEAQGMPLETLEEIRLLTNLETDQHKLLQIILFGQPELDVNLSNSSIRQLRERITHDFNLSPLTSDEIYRYLNFRMREVGYTGPELISEKLASQMARHSAGLLRRINILADKMLLSAFADGTHTLSSKHLMDAVKDSGFSDLHSVSESRKSIWTMSLLLILLVLAAAYALFQQGYRFPSFVKLEAEKVDKPVESKSLVAQINHSVADESITTNVHEVPTLAVKDSSTLPVSDEEEIVEKTQNAVVKETVSAELAETSQIAETKQTPVEMPDSSKKNQQSGDKLDKVAENQPVKVLSSSNINTDYQSWLDNKIEQSKQWLRNADKQGVSIQVMMRSKIASKDLAEYLQTEWPLDLDKTYIYEVKMKDKSIYRVFYEEYPTISLGHMKIKQLPESVRVNSPYLHSIYRMQQALL